MERIKLELPDHFPFSCTIPVRISDVNYGGHLGNDSVLTIIHEARIQFLNNLGYTELNIEGAAITMVDSVIMYTSEGFYGDILRIDVGVRSLQDSGCDFIYRLTKTTTDTEIARAKTGIVFLNRETKKIVRVPQKFKDRITALL